MNEAFRWRWCMIAALVLLIPLVTDAVEVHPPLENKITQALKTKHAVDFEDVPLSEAIKQLAAAANVPYFINREALADEGVEMESPVTLHRGAQETGITLQEILHPLLLDYEAQPEWLYVTTRAAMDDNPETRFYDVSRLVSLLEPRLILYRSPFADASPVPTESTGFSGGGGFPYPVQHARSTPKKSVSNSFHRARIDQVEAELLAERCLIAFLEQSTRALWRDLDGIGGSMMPGQGRLIIRQPRRFHTEVFLVLSQLEMMLSDPQHPPRLRLGQSDVDRKQWEQYERLLEVPTNSAPGVMPLKQFLEENFNANGVSIFVDEAALQDEGVVWKEEQITVVAGISRRTLLDEVFLHHVMEIVDSGGRIVVTTRATCDEILQTFLYDVSSLLEVRDREWLARLLMENTSGQWEEIDGVGGTLDLIGSDDLQIAGLLIVRQTEKLHEEIPEILDRLRKPLEIPVKEIEPTRTRSVYVLADAPTATDLQKMLPRLIVAPGVSWPADSILRVGSSLIVTQTEAVHHRIERLIEAMDTARKAADRPDIKADSEPKKPDTAPAEKE